MLLNEKLPSQVWEFSVENCPNGSLAKVAQFHTNHEDFLARLPNPYKLSILGDIWRAIILPFSSSKYFYSCFRLSNLVDLSFEYLTFPKHRQARRARVIFFCDLKAPVLGGLIRVTHSCVLGSRIPVNVIIKFSVLVQTLMIVVPKCFTTILQINSFPSFSPF